LSSSKNPPIPGYKEAAVVTADNMSVALSSAVKGGAWSKVNGVWYYFNANAGDWQGAMLMNCVTPDGYTVGANGAWIQ